MMFQLYIVFVIPVVLSLLITPFVIRLARRVGAMDQPNERKVHKAPIPRFGGVAIYISFFLSLVIYTFMGLALRPFSSVHPHMGVMLVISLTMVIILGIWDDVRSLSAGKKFLGQCVAATIVYLAGFRISSITHPLGPDLLSLGYLDFPATVLWIVGITNAFNLIDGLDGLASGVAFIVSLTICTISFMKGDITTAMLSLLLAGTVLGFLRYNFNGARIFLGDSGSLFIGFCLAILSMQSSTKGSAAFSILVPVLTLGLPIMDTLLAMIRRFLRSVFPEQDNAQSFPQKLFHMFLPDRGHIHHQLIARGLSHRNVVLLLYVVSCLFGIGAFVVTMTNNIGLTPILFAIGVATFIGVKQLRYKEMAVLRNGILLPLYEWPLVNSAFFQGFLDLAFIMLAYTGAYYVEGREHAPLQFNGSFYQNLTIVAGIQILVFYLNGLYKGTFRQLGMGDLLQIVKTTTLGVVLTWIVFAIFPRGPGNLSATRIVLDYYFLLSLVIGARTSYHVLNYLFRREHRTGKPILIYGAEAKGILTLQELLHDDHLNMCPVGFLDDNPNLEGKSISGYPVFGGHWKLEYLIHKMDIREIVVATDSIKPEVLRRIQQISRLHSVVVRRLKIQLEDFEVSERRQPVAQGQMMFLEKQPPRRA